MSEISCFVLYMACGGMIFVEKFSNFRKKVFHFILFHLILLCCLCYYRSKNVKRQSELSGLRPDTSSLVEMCDKFFYIVKSDTAIKNGDVTNSWK